MVTHESSALPPQPPPKESFTWRYKFLWPVLVAINLAIGGFMILLFFYQSTDGVYKKLISGLHRYPWPNGNVPTNPPLPS
ncbi:hypothetical protein CFP56_042714 [Quercus suber]|uniref:Uncharacterized protein n=1 Tax=Quercus suber TaxID=58331 RepID=A0AAW0LLH0_QUESU